MKSLNYKVEGIDCKHCAKELEEEISKLEGISNCKLEFGTPSFLSYDYEGNDEEGIEKQIIKIIEDDQENPVITRIEEHHDKECCCHEHHHHDEEHTCECGHDHHHHEHEECNCGHEHHHHHHEHHHTKHVEFNIDGIDCANCAKELEEEIGKLHGVSNCTLEFGIHSHLKYDVETEHCDEVEESMRKIIEDDQENPVITRVENQFNTTHVEFTVDGIDCANCAKELEEEIGKLDGVSNCALEFGIHSHLKYDVETDKNHIVEEQMRKIIEDDQENPVITKMDEKKLKHQSFVVDGIDCANCAKELEEEIEKLDGVSNCVLEFGIHSHLDYDVDPTVMSSVEMKMRKIIEDDQENPIIKKVSTEKEKTYKFNIKNIDCADCANELAEETENIEGVKSCEADFMNQVLIVKCDPKDKSRIASEMKEMISKSEPEVEFSEYVKENKKPQEEDTNDKVMLTRMVVGAVLFVCSLFTTGVIQIVVSLAAYLILGYDVLLKAVRGVGRGQLFDEHFLMAVATLAAIYQQEWKEAAGVMLFYQIGEYFQDLAVRRSRRSIGELMDIRPDYAMVERDGDFIKVDPDEVTIDEIIRVKPGERVPLDGIVVMGSSSLDTASLTGESKLRDVDEGDEVISGSVNETGVLEIKVTKEYGESTVAKILDLVENNDSNKAQHEKFITKFSKYYTPIVVFLAIAVAIFVGIFMGDFNEGIRRACTFLVISCPCALVISIPLSFFAGIGGLSSRGVLVKGANIIDSLAKVKQVVMDKTGTLTSGEFAVEEVLGNTDKETLIYDAACAEHFSNHPIAQGIKSACKKDITDDLITDVEEIAGRGLSVKVDGIEVLAGNYKLMQDKGILCEPETSTGTLVYVAKNGKYEGCLILRDQLKSDSIEAIQELQKEGKKCIIVSGDNQEITNEIGNKLHVDQAVGGCMPEDKVNVVKNVMKEGMTAFVGDGVNDAPVITLADVGIAMGALGSDAAIEAADVVLMDDSPSKISLAISASKRILFIANENIYGAITIKVLTLIFGALGIANMWWAIFADTGVAMLCVLNSLRLLRISRK